jgi:hypothetical protein
MNATDPTRPTTTPVATQKRSYNSTGPWPTTCVECSRGPIMTDGNGEPMHWFGHHPACTQCFDKGVEEEHKRQSRR